MDVFATKEVEAQPIKNKTLKIKMDLNFTGAPPACHSSDFAAKFERLTDSALDQTFLINTALPEAHSPARRFYLEWKDSRSLRTESKARPLKG